MTGVGGLGDCERGDITSLLEKSETANNDNNDNNLFSLEQIKLVNSKEKGSVRVRRPTAKRK